MTQLNFGRDVQGMNAFAPMPSDIMYSANVPAGGSNAVEVPSSNENWIVVFSYQAGSTIWVSINDVGAPPAGGIFLPTTSFLMPAQYKLKAGDVISCYNATGSIQQVGIAFYAIP